MSPVEYVSRLFQALRLQVLPISWQLITADEKLRALPELNCIW